MHAPFKQAWPWPRWTVAVISNRVTNIYACNVDRDHAKVVVMDKRPFYKGGRISRFDCNVIVMSANTIYRISEKAIYPETRYIGKAIYRESDVSRNCADVAYADDLCKLDLHTMKCINSVLRICRNDNHDWKDKCVQ